MTKKHHDDVILHNVKSEREWLALRRKCVTATEVPSLLGVNPYLSGEQMWRNKTERTFKGNSYTYIGNLLESVVVQVTNDVLHRNFTQFEGEDGAKRFLMSEELKIGATPDAGDNTTFLECKTTKPHNFDKYVLSPPNHYIVQAATQLYLDKTKKSTYLSILSTDLTQETDQLRLPLVVHEIKRNQELENLIEQEVKRFWKTRKDGVPFRVKSEVKRSALILCKICCNRIHRPGEHEDEN